MSEDRIKELQEFADDFKRRLRNAKEIYEQSSSKSIDLEESNKMEQPNNQILINKSQRIMKQKHKFVNNIFFKIII